MEWKKEKLQSLWRINKEKLIFLFCSGLLLFLLSMPEERGKQTGQQLSGASQAVSGAAAGTMSDREGEGFVPGTGYDDEKSYEKQMEERIRDILSRVDGVGEADVMVVVLSSEEKILQIDKSTSTSVDEEGKNTVSRRVQTQQEMKESTVMSGHDLLPFVKKEMRPEISGIIISADGGGSSVVKTEICEAMEALFGLPAHKIKVLKRVKKGV